MRLKVAGSLAIVAAVLAAVLLASRPGEDETTKTAPPKTLRGVEANLWVNTTAGVDPSRCSTPCAYRPGAAYGSLRAAAAAAVSGDVIRIRAGTYGPQGSIGSVGKTLAFTGEDGVRIDSGREAPAYNTLRLNGGVTLDNVDVTGDAPIVQIFGSGNRWTNSRLDQRQDAIRPCNGDEPLLIQDGDAPAGRYTIEGNTLGPYLTLGRFKGYSGDVLPACPDGYLHLAQVRLGRGARDITFDRVTFEPCRDGPGFVGCGSGHIFFTDCCGGAGSPPTGITVRNSRFLGADPFAMQAGAQMRHTADWTFAYNFFANSPLADDGAVAGITFVGNAGPRLQACTSGYVWTRNVWQHAEGTPCGSDTLVPGPNYQTTRLGIGDDGRTRSRSPLIDAAEPGRCPDAGGIDADGARRPTGRACDAGPDEVAAATGTSARSG